MAKTNDMREVARRVVKTSLAKGAKEAAARTYKVREVSVQWRDGKLEQINEATTRGVGLQLYVDGRYSMASSSDLRPEALDQFIADSVAMTRALAVDPFRSLPDPALYEGRAKLDLQLQDPAYAAVTAEQRREIAKEIEAGARAVKGAEAILSVTTSFSDTLTEELRLASNGFEGERVTTAFFTSAGVTVKDQDGRRPEDFAYGGVRFLGEMPSATGVGRQAAERAIGRLGSKKGESAVLPMVLENRSGGRLVSALIEPLSASALQQKRSFLEGKVGQAIGSELLTIADDPHVPKGFGSRLYDNEGLAAKRLPVVEKGVLRNYFVDTYYGKKLNLAPTTGSPSNGAWALGDKPVAGLIAEVKDGIYVTGFLGGNSNATTGDFSLGVKGFRIRGGALAEPVSEMNISGNMAEMLKRLVAVGNDPFPYSSLRTPTLVFEGVQFAGL